MTASFNNYNIRLSVCICTRNRPEDLLKALLSINESHIPIHETIVSDDSTDNRTEKLVKEHFPNVLYLAGPRKGLSANRNNAIRAATGTHLMFIDDDVVLAADFLEKICQSLLENEPLYGRKLIITGLENKRGDIIYPHDQTFLGFQKRRYEGGDAIKTVVINSTVFPMSLFEEILFDEQLIYGYEEVDFATRAVGRGYTIVLTEEAVNFHYPSEVNRDFYRPHIVTSRLYVTFKKYMYTEKKAAKAVSFLLVAFTHAMLHGIKAEGAAGLSKSLGAIASSIRYIRVHTKQASKIRKTSNEVLQG
ncbi:glycosyltransferase family 2 protein [Paenibacillus hamazuiensis]|uniref:glycosyltransferase family 2 protein n=1 Tax=Paenibacillus hamazuiensis TaxID=2936508 RepID=UPI0023DEE752|nr:glycosyltransferase [Paenibacillus hamazuiensis]